MNPHDDAWCKDNARVPESLVDSHSAPLDITFMQGQAAALPSKWQRGAFVTLHGSWNRTPSTGFKVVWIPWNESGRPELPTVDDSGPKFTYEVVFGGGNPNAPRDGTWGWMSDEGGEDVVRPVGVAISPKDGALYVSSDNGQVLMTADETPPNGAIYRIALRR
jgi:glucose/arabinose dehydrogenase